MCKNQRRYKGHSKRNVRREPKFKIGDFKFVYGPQLAAIATNAADEMMNSRYNKLFLRASGLYKVLGVPPHTGAIEGDGIPNSVYTDRLTQSPTRHQVTDNLR